MVRIQSPFPLVVPLHGHLCPQKIIINTKGGCIIVENISPYIRRKMIDYWTSNLTEPYVSWQIFLLTEFQLISSTADQPTVIINGFKQNSNIRFDYLIVFTHESGLRLTRVKVQNIRRLKYGWVKIFIG